VPRPWPVTDLSAELRSGSQLTLPLATRVAELWSWAPALDDPRRVDELHAMRLSAKRLRYLLEDLRPLLGKGAGKAVKRLRRLQDALGAVHDCDVRAETLRAALSHQEARRQRLLQRVTGPAHAGDARVAAAADELADGCAEVPSAGLARLLAECVAERAERHAALRRRFAKLERQGLRERLVELGS